MGNIITNKLEASVQKGKYLQTTVDSLMPLMKKSSITYSNEMLEIFSTNIGQINEIMNPLLNKMHIMIGMLEKLMSRGDYPESEYPAAIKEYHSIENDCVKKLDALQKSMNLTINRSSKETHKDDNAFIGPSMGYIKKMDGMLNAVKGHLGRATVKWKDSEKANNLTAGEKTLVELLYGENHNNFIKAFYREHYAPLIIAPFELLQVKESAMESDFSATSLSDGFNKVKEKYRKKLVFDTFFIHYKDDQASDHFLEVKLYRDKRWNVDDVIKCIDAAEREWMTIRNMLVAKVMRIRSVSEAIKSKGESKDDITKYCTLTNVGVEYHNGVPSAYYQFQWGGTVLQNSVVGANYCPYGKFTSSVSKLSVSDIYETYGR